MTRGRSADAHGYELTLGKAADVSVNVLGIKAILAILVGFNAKDRAQRSADILRMPVSRIHDDDTGQLQQDIFAVEAIQPPGIQTDSVADQMALDFRPVVIEGLFQCPQVVILF